MTTPSQSSVRESADWCIDRDDVVICGTRMVEHSRTPAGVRWCFRCRRRAEFELVITVPDGPSWYGPNARIECSNCKAIDGDCFPGCEREWSED